MMDALQTAKEAAEWVDGENPTLDEYFMKKAQAYAAIASAEAAQRQAAAMEHVAMHLGNIHQRLITPDAEGNPIAVADLLKRIAKALETPELYSD